MFNFRSLLALMQVLTVAAWISPHSPNMIKLNYLITGNSPSSRTLFSRKATTSDEFFGISRKRAKFNLNVHPPAPVEEINSVDVSALTKLCEIANETALAGWQLSQADPTNGRDRDGCNKML